MISLTDVTKVYRMGTVEVHALRGVSLHIDEDEMVAIMGPSGSGKSTLMNIIGCLDTPTAGRYHLAGQDVSQMDDDQSEPSQRWRAWGWGSAWITGPTSCPAASSNGWPSPALW